MPKRHGQALRLLRGRSDPGTPEALSGRRDGGAVSREPPPAAIPAGGAPVLAVEPFFKIAREAVPIFSRHWEELALNKDVIPLELDFDRYLDMSATGMLQIVTARSGGALVGYIFNLVGPHLHYKSTLHAELEMFWLDPAFRAGWFPVKMFRFNEEHLKSLGVKRVNANVKIHFMAGRVGKLFERLGYAPTEVSYGKVL